MQIQTKCMRRNSIVSVLLVSGSLFSNGQGLLADGPTASPKAKQVPSYVAAHFDKPKNRSVHTNKATVRSGPSEKYYATSTLLSGAAVDVYMETSDGWSGIRPPSGSHDWIPSNIAYLLPGGKAAEVIEDKSPAWVGSESPNISEFMWQTELTKSQQVQVLGEELQMTDDGKKQLWYRIAPPQGEFRWVKTSQLSDTQPTISKDQGVQLASFVDDSTPAPISGKPNPQSGKVVWSDEQQAIAQVEKQIQQEQAQIQSKMAADGIRVNINSPAMEVKSRGTPLISGTSGTPAKLVSNSSTTLQDTDPESILVDSEEPTVAMPTTTRIRPIPSRANARRTKNTTNSAEHQVDGQRQWEAMQSTDPKLRIKPMSSLLGLIGFSVIEADRIPATTAITQQFDSTPSQGNIGRIGPVGNSRLDRLPRPGHRGPTMALPPDSSPYNGSGYESPQYEQSEFESTPGWNTSSSLRQPVPSGAPMNQGESTFARWMNSREPIFGAAPPSNYPSAQTGAIQMVLQSQNMDNKYGMQPTASPLVFDTTAWHGLNPSMRNQNTSPTSMAMNSDNLNSDEDPEEFRTPEIQSALAQLTQVVASPTENWNFSQLRNQAASWVENGANPLVRGEARLLIERIDRFESLRQRTMGLAREPSLLAQQSNGFASNLAVRQASSVTPTTAPAGLNGSMVSNAIANGSNTIATNAMSQSQGDASGWLVQVHTSIIGQPEFALTDDAGKVIAYVQSTASLNLRRYLQQPVTVYGARGYIPSLAAKQILAERVVRMR